MENSQLYEPYRLSNLKVYLKQESTNEDKLTNQAMNLIKIVLNAHSSNIVGLAAEDLKKRIIEELTLDKLVETFESPHLNSGIKNAIANHFSALPSFDLIHLIVETYIAKEAYQEHAIIYNRCLEIMHDMCFTTEDLKIIK